MEVFNIKDNIFYLPNYELLVVNKNKIIMEKEEIVEKVKKTIENKINKLDLKLLSEVYDKPVDKTFVTNIGIYFTNNCQLKCSYCFYRSGNEDNNQLSVTELKSIVDMLIKNATIKKMVFHLEKYPKIEVAISGGGEPTFSLERFKCFVNYLKEKCNELGIEHEINLTTNGMYDEEKMKYISENIHEVNFSFDGLPELQNHNRPLRNGKNSFDVIDQVFKYFDLKEKIYGIRTTLTSANFKDMKKMCDFIFSNYKFAKVWHIETVVDSGRASSDDTYKNNDFGEYFNELYEYAKEKYPDRIIYNSSYSYILKTSFCNSTVGTSYWIDAHGEIVTCTDLDNKKLFLKGKYNNGKIIANDNFNMNDYFEKRDIMCSNCFIKYICAGGCPERFRRDQNGKFIYESGKITCENLKKYWLNKFENLVTNNICADLIAKKNIELSDENFDYYLIERR